MDELNYYLDYTATPITLDLWEAELYYPAVIVQQLIGNLTYYSNHGRYETRLAESWERTDLNVWKFKIKRNLHCENGELITADSFKESIQRSMLFLSKKGGSPILSKLKGYKEFIQQNKGSYENIKPINGISTNGDVITFEFTKPIRSGLVQILAFAPFGYICKENLNKDGSWKNNKSFISSGPYKLDSVEIGKAYSLVKRPNFEEINGGTKISKVNFLQGLPSSYPKNVPSVVDSPKELASLPSDFKKYQIYQEYVLSVALGNFTNGIFRSVENRKVFKNVFNIFKFLYESESLDKTISWSMYPSQDSRKFSGDMNVIKKFKDYFVTSEAILIRGKIPNPETRSWKAWGILKSSLDHLGLRYKFSETEYTRHDVTNQNYDARIISPSVGGGVEGWILDVLFCSKLNSQLPDPENNICKLVETYDLDIITEQELTKMFFEIIENDSALIPVSHFGMEKYFTKQIEAKSVGPALSVIRIDELGLTNAYN